jgi:hypothetical protein
MTVSHNPGSIYRKAAISAEGVTGISSAGVFDPTEFSTKTAPVAADLVVIQDTADSNAPKRSTLTNCQKILGEIAAGTASSSGLTEVDGVLKVAPTDEPLVPATGYFLTQNAAGAPHKDLVSDVVALIGGTAATTGLSNSSGVLTAAIKLLHCVADDKVANFLEVGEFDFSGSASAVDTKIIDSMAAKGQLLFALISVSQVADGTTSAGISISKAAGAATKMANDLTITLADTVYQNKINNLMMMWPVSGANSIVDAGATGDVYMYAAASGGRTAGKVRYVLFFLKTV